MKTRHHARWLLALAALVTLPALGQATSPPGRLLASNCFQCHGTNGKGPGFDSLAGKSSGEILKELQEMRSGKEGDGLMTRHAFIYTDLQLKQIADWFAAQPRR